MGDEQPAPGQGQQQQETYTPPATQGDLDRIITERVSRERSKYADYADLKAKAKQFDAAQDANKSETQKLTDQLQAVQQQLAARDVETMRLRVISKHNIPDEYASLVTGGDEQALEEQATLVGKLLAGSSKGKGIVNLRIPSEGSSPEVPKNVSGDWLRNEFNRK